MLLIHSLTRLRSTLNFKEAEFIEFLPANFATFIYKYSIGVFKQKEEDVSQLELVGHAPVELSRLLNHFLKAHVGNSIYVEVTGKRKREVGLVVPAKFSPRTKSTRTAKILDEQLDRIKEKFTTLEFKHRQKRLYRKFPIYQKIK